MRHMWMNAIEKTHPEWVEIITWNDFIEGTYISPIDDPNRYANANFLTASGVPTNTRGYFHSHAAAGELMRFYIEWYKTGKQPAITHDSVYWFYRTQAAGSHAAAPKVEHKYGPVSDVIYVTANLTAPAELHVQCGKHESEVHLAAGSSDTAVLFTAGSAPQFRLMRGGKLVVAGAGQDGIAASPPLSNYYYSTGMMGR